MLRDPNCRLKIAEIACASGFAVAVKLVGLLTLTFVGPAWVVWGPLRRATIEGSHPYIGRVGKTAIGLIATNVLATDEGTRYTLIRDFCILLRGGA
jgi:hypothetical protein